MKTSVATVRRIAIASALVSLSSCSLPPSAAWKIIRNDGLGSYIAMETGKKPFPPDMEVLRNRNRIHSAPIATTGAALATTSSPYFNSANAPVSSVAEPRPRVPASASRLVFEVQPNGRGIVPASTAHGEANTTSPSSRTKTPVTEPKKAPVAKTTVKTEPTASKPKPVESKAPVTAPKKTTPAVVSGPKKAADKAPEPSTAPVKKSSAAASSTTPKVASNDTATAPAKTIAELPYGTPVPGRSGLVHSPYAGKLQLVDVSGLAPGQEVKCPYSGKLFRVPSGEQAAAKKTDGTPPAAKSEDEKKQ